MASGLLGARRTARTSYARRVSFPTTMGHTITTQPRRMPPRTQPRAAVRRTPAPRAPEVRGSAAKRPVARRGAAAPPYRPNYWLVGAMGVLVVGLTLAFLLTILILWSIAGAPITLIMVGAYAAVMYVLWRVGLSRL